MNKSRQTGKKGIYRTFHLFEFQSTNMSNRNVVNYYSKGVDYYDKRDFAKAIASLNTFIAETDSKKNKDVALAQRYVFDFTNTFSCKFWELLSLQSCY